MLISFPEFVPTHAGPVRVKRQGHASAPVRRGIYRNIVKRVFDATAVVLSAPIIVPLVAALAITARRDGGGAFYSQLRIGKGGRTFRIWKLRTMVPDADARLESHLAADPAARAEWTATQKLRDDPRITPVGQFLRRSSLDELPQLWNVLCGDMSLVGPRPMMPSQQDLYPGTAYYAVRPGITGLWQTDGRNATTFSARAGYDTAYEATLSLAGDLRILWRTVGVVLRGTGC